MVNYSQHILIIEHVIQLKKTQKYYVLNTQNNIVAMMMNPFVILSVIGLNVQYWM